MREIVSFAGVMLLCATMAACASIGPATVPRDRVDYSDAISASWKEQMLLNIVRLRYADTPVFLEVTSVINSYAVQAQFAAAGQIGIDSRASLANLAATAVYLDRPTITYTPLTGDQFTKSLLRPIPPAAIFALIQAGYPSDFVLRVSVRALNGIHNRSSGLRGRAADPRFHPLLEALRRVQQSGVVGTRMEKRGQEDTALLLFPDHPTPEQQADITFVFETLKLKPEDGEIDLAFGPTQRRASELAVLSRSMMEILIELAAGVEVPDEDLAEGRTIPGYSTAPDAPAIDRPILRIRWSPNRSSEAFTGVRYRDRWYWIDDRDFASKRALTFLMLFFSLAQTGIAASAPVITIPAN